MHITLQLHGTPDQLHKFLRAGILSVDSTSIERRVSNLGAAALETAVKDGIVQIIIDRRTRIAEAPMFPPVAVAGEVLA